MTSMVERVARVLAGKHWDENPAYRDHYKTLALAVLEEMREPTEAMQDAGNVPTYQWIDNTADDVWSRMIDAALKEEPKQ